MSFSRIVQHLDGFFSPIVDCPPSLRLMVQLYRFLGFSFSGVVFSRPHSHRPLQSLTFLSLHLFAIFMTVYTLEVQLALGTFASSVTAPSNTTTTADGNFFQSTTRAFYAEFHHFKPILRTILTSMATIFMIDNLINYPLNLLAGRQLLASIIRISSSEQQLDVDYSLVWKILGGSFVFNVLALCLAFSSFSRQYAIAWFYWLFQNSTHRITDQQKIELVQILPIMLLMPVYLEVHLLSTNLYLYSVIIVRRHIKRLRQQLKHRPVDEPQLYQLKANLKQLSERFADVIRRLSLPLTWANIGQVYVIISSVCFFMVAPNREHYLNAFIFIYGTFGFFRLLLVCWAANLPTNAFERLCLQMFESIGHWSVDNWMLYREIKQMKGKFQTNIWSTYTLNQAAILSMLGFALNYIVVLLQTESYGTMKRN